jgi:hypothetical protein
MENEAISIKAGLIVGKGKACLEVVLAWQVALGKSCGYKVKTKQNSGI